MLDRTFVLQDGAPHRLGVDALFVEQALQIGVLDRERARQGLVGVDVGRDRFDAGRRAAADDRDRGGRGDRQLVAEPLHHAALLGVQARALLLGQPAAGLIGLATQVLEQAHVPRLGHGAFEGDALTLQEGVEAHQTQTHRTLALGRIDGGGHGGRGAADEVFQHIVQEPHQVLDEARLLAPFQEGLGVDRRQAADGGPVHAQMVAAGVQHDLGAQVRLFDLKAQVALVRRHLAVHRVREDQIGLAGLHADVEQLGPQRTGVDGLHDRAVLGRLQVEGSADLDRLHELVGDVDAVVQVQGLAIEVARRFADLQELFDFRVVDIQIDGGRTAAQRTLADRQRQAVHHADEGDDARGLARALDLFADGADAAPIGADAAAVRGQGHVLVPDVLDAVQAVAHRVQEAGDRQAAIRTAVRQDRGRRHEPQAAHIIIQALGVFGVVREGGRNAREHVLIAFARQQIAIFQRLLAEIRQQIVARAIDLDRFHHGQMRTFRRRRRRNALEFRRLQCLAASHGHPRPEQKIV